VSRAERAALAFILLVAAALRLTGLDWDGFQHHHPDERYITWVATTIEFPRPGSMSRADWQPQTSTFNPFHWPPAASSEGIVVLQDEPRDFAYGHLPLYLGVLATRFVERLGPLLIPLLPAGWSLTGDVLNGAGRIEFHHLAIVGRALTALFDVGTVGVVFLLGRRLYGVGVALLASAFLAVAVLPIQLAHFFTSDPYLTFFAVAALYALVAGHGAGDARRRQRWWLAAGALIGLAVGSKFSAILLFAPLLWAIGSGERAGRRWAEGLAAVAVAVLVFALTNPFALLDRTCPAPAEWPRLGPLAAPEALVRSCYLQNLAEQSAMARGTADLGFTRQYTGTVPYLYFIEMQIRWGLGPLLGVVAFAGLGWAIWGLLWPPGAAGSDGWTRLRREPVVIPLLWVVPYFLITGAFAVKFMRYMQPILPLLVLFGAAMLWAGGRRWQERRATARPGRWAGGVAGIVLAFTALYAAAFMAIYSTEHPWNAASRWVYEHVPPGTTLLSEQWDDYLPVPLLLDGQRHLRNEYPNVELTWLSRPDAADDEAKLRANLEALAAADYVTILSNRVYGVVPRLPDRYPLSSRYHQLLFDGELGYELAWVGGRAPRLFGLTVRLDTFAWPGLTPPAAVAAYLRAGPALSFGRVDESFVVYDQPLTMIFRNTGRLTAEQMRAAFDAGATD